MCKKRQPTYKSLRRYKKRSTDCPFQLKFTKHENQKYRLTDGTYYHNHMLTMPVLDPQILNHLDRFDPVTAKAANVRKFINQKFGTDIQYAQIAYELSKRKKKYCGVQYQQDLKDFIKQCENDKEIIIETYMDKSDSISRALFFSRQSIDNYKRYRDVMIIYKYDNFLLFAGVNSSANITPFAVSIMTNTIIDDYLWAFSKF